MRLFSSLLPPFCLGEPWILALSKPSFIKEGWKECGNFFQRFSNFKVSMERKYIIWWLMMMDDIFQ